VSVNQFVDNKLEFCVGFANGDLAVLTAGDTIQKPAIRQFKEGTLTNSVITCVVWLNDTQFYVGLADGQILVIDKNRDDPSLDQEENFVNNYPNDIKRYCYS
jgi:hypothetical protein